MDELLSKLADRLRVYNAEVVSADDMADWPTGKLDELVKTGVLEEIQHSKGVVCRECEENCFIEPNIRTNPDTNEATGIFICTRNPDIGRIEVDLDRMKQWRIDNQKLSELGYQVQVGLIVPWNEKNTEYFSLKEAVNLASDDSITLRSMSRLLENTEFPIRRMRKGRRCMVHKADFGQWLQDAPHGKITDGDIEKYLNGVNTRKKAAKKKKRPQVS